MLSINEKCKIISQAAHSYIDLDLLQGFFTYNDVGVPLSQCITYELCSPNEEGERAISETWSYLCELVDKDENANYDSIDDLLSDYLETLM
jgi:hypothetical protein